MLRKRKRINVAGIEDLTAVERARALAVVRIERVRYTAEVARCAIDQVRVGIRKLGGKTRLVFKANTCLQGVIVRVGLVLFLVDAAKAWVDAEFVGKDLAALICVPISVWIGGGATQPTGIDDFGPFGFAGSVIIGGVIAGELLFAVDQKLPGLLVKGRVLIWRSLF